MKRNIMWHVFQGIALFLQLLAEVLTVVVVLKLNMLPDKYVAVVVAVLVALTATTAMLMYIKVNGNVARWRRIVACVLALLFTCGCALISKFAIDTHNLLGSVTGDISGTPKTYVLVRKEDTAQSLTDIKDHAFGAIEGYDTENTNKVIAEIQKETGKIPALTYYKQAEDMVEALYQGKVNVLIMNGVSISHLEENLHYQDFLTRVRILYSFDADEKNDETEKNLTKEPFVFYISGSDTRNKKLTVSLSDVNILAIVNPKTKQILLVNTPRDYYVPNSAGDGALDKLTHCGKYGIDCSVDAMEGLYDVVVDDYGKINFYGFKALIDAIGGVTVHSDQDFTTNEGIHIKKGENKLNGEEALAFARDRKHVSGGDNGRGKNQMRVVKAVIEKLTASTALISNYADILKSLEGMLLTSFEMDEISSLVKMQLSDMARWNIQNFAVTGRGDLQITYSYSASKLSVMWPDEESVEYASKLIKRVMAGEILTEADMTMPK